MRVVVSSMRVVVSAMALICFTYGLLVPAASSACLLTSATLSLPLDLALVPVLLRALPWINA
jgi:hypothetical protein